MHILILSRFLSFICYLLFRQLFGFVLNIRLRVIVLLIHFRNLPVAICKFCFCGIQFLLQFFCLLFLVFSNLLQLLNVAALNSFNFNQVLLLFPVSCNLVF